MSEDLKPCDHCDCVRPFLPRVQREEKCFWVECPCGMKTAEFTHRVPAIRQWNRRGTRPTDDRVEDTFQAVAERLQVELDQMTARCERLLGIAGWVGKQDLCIDYAYLNKVKSESPAQSLLLHDADVLENAGNQLMDDSNNAYVNGYAAHSGGVVDAANILLESAARLRKEAQDA